MRPAARCSSFLPASMCAVQALVLFNQIDAVVGWLPFSWAAKPTGDRSTCAYDKLEKGLGVPCNNKACVFDDVVVTATFPSGWIMAGDGEGRKAIIDPKYAFSPRHECAAYGAGIADDWSFEASLVKSCEVHAFDCTVWDVGGMMAAAGIRFAPTCIGRDQALTVGELYQQQLRGTRGSASVKQSAPERMKRKVRDRGDLHWEISGPACYRVINKGESCAETCAVRGSGGCSEDHMRSLANAKILKATVQQFGKQCDRMTANHVAGSWDGPWVADNGDCEYNDHADWQPSCSTRAACGNHRVCACNQSMPAITLPRNISKPAFEPLNMVLKDRGHMHLDMLKIDIEGGEWPLFEEQILNANNSGGILPNQISFELHTKFGNMEFVSQALAGAKGRRAVNLLFMKLWKLGYRVVSKELNRGDAGCAEFVVARLGMPMGIPANKAHATWENVIKHARMVC